MHKIIGFYNRNRKIIWLSIFAIILLYVILQILNNDAKNKQNSSSNVNTTTVNNSYSFVSQTTIDNNSAKNINLIIKEFFDYCNSNRVEEAYNLLSKDCKQEMFPTEQDFKNNYELNMFKTKKIYEANAWISNNIGNTYILTISDDILSSGDTNNNSTQEYFTAVDEDGEYKLNINNYVGTEEINKSIEKNNLQITVLRKKIYINYEKYIIKVTNKTNNAILLDGFRTGNSVYLLDNKGNKKKALLSEINQMELLVQRNLTIIKEIKFDRIYNTDLVLKSINFDDIILNYNEYIKSENKNNYNDILKIEINI